MGGAHGSLRYRASRSDALVLCSEAHCPVASCPHTVLTHSDGGFTWKAGGNSPMLPGSQETCCLGEGDQMYSERPKPEA